jgi:hypothetical protein
MPVLNGRAFGAVCLLGLSAPATAAGLPDCDETDMEAPRIYQDEADEHRLFERTVVSYPPGTELDSADSLASLTVRLDASGRPTCFVGMDGHFIGPRVAQKLRAAARDWRYRPFERDGKAVPVLVHQWIDMQILPGRTVNVPPILPKDSSVTLVRAGCFWQCPEYAITVRGDGWVGYQPIQFVDIAEGRAWKIPADEVAAMLKLARDPGLWAADDRYLDPMFDAETIMLRVDAGGRRKQVVIYPANTASAPIALRRLAEEIDRRTGVHRWVDLSQETLDALQAEGFDFGSPAGRDLLVRSLRYGRNFDAAAVGRLLELGVSAETPASPEGGTVLDTVLLRRHTALVEPLIERGVLLTDGKPDQAKIDSAFRAAIRGGLLAPAQRIWNIAGTRPHPALDFADTGRGKVPSLRRSPVALLLVDPPFSYTNSEAEQIARWLGSLGNDLRSVSENGKTLMHAAVQNSDPGFMRFLLAQGLDPAVVGQSDLTKFSVRHGEDMALALLDAQLARRPGGWALPADFQAVAERQDWPRVMAWLEAHPQVNFRRKAGDCPPATQVATAPLSKTKSAASCARARPAGD